MKSIELFSGAGGLALGLHNAGFKHRVLVEADYDAFRTLEKNVAVIAVEGIADWRILNQRVEDTDFSDCSDIDLAAAGIPCQPFSNGGLRRGFADHRNMFPTFTKVLFEVRPKSFILENVTGLVGGEPKGQLDYVHLQLSFPGHAYKTGQSWQQHHRGLKKLSTVNRDSLNPTYTVKYKILNTADYGVPQIRRRVFFVGIRNDLSMEWEFPAATHSRDKLLHDQWVSGDYWQRHGIGRTLKTKPSQAKVARLSRMESYPGLPWQTFRDSIIGLPKPSRSESSSPVSQHVYIPGARSYPGHTGSPIDSPAKSIKAGTHGVPGGENMVENGNGSLRYFTVREAARIQTFPDTWEFSGEWSQITKQIGNAVPVRLVTILGNSIKKALKATEPLSTTDSSGD